jgi:hypothetical protein
MNEENTVSNMDDDVQHVVCEHQCPKNMVPVWFAVLLVVMLLLEPVVSTLVYGRPGEDKKVCATNDTVVKAQVEAQSASIKSNMERTNQESMLRLEVIKACVGRGDIPVLMNGNVDCKHLGK